MECKQVLILEDEPNTRKLLAKAIANEKQLELSAAFGTLTEAKEHIDLHGCPDILLVDLGLPDGGGIDLIRCAKLKNEAAEIMVISSFGDETSVVNAIEAGASGYLYKDESLDEINRHLKTILRGESPISPSIARHVLKRMQLRAKPQSQSASHGEESILTVREKDVLNMLARGYSRLETATNLEISPHTVTTHIKNIYRKLAVRSRTEAIFEASQLGLIHINE
ncbi:response regulator transcription factor [Mariprofundus ferrooxydans]|nr:response regulator transcription factor [Mariprofundus ferrooxydans]